MSVLSSPSDGIHAMHSSLLTTFVIFRPSAPFEEPVKLEFSTSSFTPTSCEFEPRSGSVACDLFVPEFKVALVGSNDVRSDFMFADMVVLSILLLRLLSLLLFRLSLRRGFMLRVGVRGAINLDL